MRIPTGQQFGNEVARYTPVPVASARDLDGGIGAAASRIGEGIQGLANQQIAEDRKQALIAQRAQAALTLAETQNDAYDAHDEVVRGVADGSIPTDKAEGELSTRIAKLRDERFQPLNEEQRGAIADNLETTRGALTRNLRGVVVKKQQSDTGVTIDQFGEQASRDAMRIGPAAAADKYDALVDFAGTGAGWSPELAAKKKQAFRETAHYTFFDAAGTEALTNGDAAAMGRVLDAVKGKDGEALDPLKRVQLTHQLFGYQQHILAAQARAANAADQEQVRRENEAAVTYNQGVDILASGGVLSPTFIQTATANAAGTKSQGDMLALLRGQADISGFATKTRTEREAFLTKWRTDRATPGVGTDTATEKMLGALTTINDKIIAGVKDDPWEAASKAGRLQSQPLDISSPTTLIDGVKQRMQSISSLEAWTGEPESPLRPAETAQVQKLLRAMPPDLASTALGSLGAALGDSGRVAAVAKQIHDKDGTLGLAMGYANQGTTEGRLVGELLLRGDQAVKDGTIKLDSAKVTGWRSTIAKAVRGAYSNQQVEDSVVNAAFLIAAAKDGDTDNAIRLATGGGIVDFNGSRVPMPAGYAADGGQSGAEDRFRKAIESVPPEQLMPQAPDGNVYLRGVPMRASDFLASLPKAQLVHAGAGAYWVKAGNTLAATKSGQPIVIRLP